MWGCRGNGGGGGGSFSGSGAPKGKTVPGRRAGREIPQEAQAVGGSQAVGTHVVIPQLVPGGQVEVGSGWQRKGLEACTQWWEQRFWSPVV